MPASLRRYLPALIVLLALVLRLWGIAWGLPDASHLFSYHPDESRVVGQALMQPGQNILDTGFYNYGSLATLTDRFLLLATGALTNIPTASSLLLVRLVTVAYGIGTCALLILLGKRLEKPDVGLSAAALYAVAPLAVQHGHFATVDVPATFWVTASLLTALTNPKLFWCGLFAGLAAATKYNAGLALLAGVDKRQKC
nr:glycosyltransferase family 39 protein [Armatimonas sp.]